MEICRKCRGSGNVVVSYGPITFKKCGCRVPTFGSAEIIMGSKVKATMESASFSISSLEPHERTMAHIMAKAGAFKSVNDAKRNGWDRPAEVGQFLLKKKNATVVVTA